ncbi:swi5-dependent recombination DNA repair protein 1 homolog [Megalops cyprinoides]|uniref:swi5-dependent recombination DNA repair protein 1 homolog n=1 Tax=Megalops cyprinoides TaxID=118141 RepID=UPI001863F3A8|nr:swi5-dependent recombination DNA repair protein 1 homolog [Megalops cyprinoides]
METPSTSKSKPVYRTPDASLHSIPHTSWTQKPMSASLKERLKRTRRSFKSPFSVVKRLKIDSEEEDLTASKEEKRATVTEETEDPQIRPETVDIDGNHNEQSDNGNDRAQSSCSTEGTAQPSQTDLLQLRDTLKKEVQEKTETLRRLNMVKTYRKKNDLTQLRCLIAKWRRCSQAALLELQSCLLIDGRKANLSQLIDDFGLEDRMLHFDRDEEDFTDE